MDSILEGFSNLNDSMNQNLTVCGSVSPFCTEDLGDGNERVCTSGS